MNRYVVNISCMLSLIGALLCMSASVSAQTADAGLNLQVAAFLDEWHDDAAHANYRYFDKMSADGVYIGTDQSERWVRDEFKAWAKPFFDRKKAWEFHAFNRHIAYSDDKSVIWFDEQLHTQMGVCQASGVIRNGKDGLKIAHYQLSLAIPNALVDHIKKEIDAADPGAKK